MPHMRTHELHPMLIHAPLVMLPAAAAADLMSSLSSSLIRRRALSMAGKTLWWGTAGSALLAGLSGMAASQEVEADEHVQEMMFTHGAGNAALLIAAIGVASWRTTHRASLATGLLGTGAVLAAVYTAWLGGEMVYSHGTGVKEHGKRDASERNPPLFSARAPGVLLRDAASGFAWIAGRLLRRGRARGGDRHAQGQFSGPRETTTAISEGQFTAPY